MDRGLGFQGQGEPGQANAFRDQGWEILNKLNTPQRRRDTEVQRKEHRDFEIEGFFSSFFSVPLCLCGTFEFWKPGTMDTKIKHVLDRGVVIPAHPLALNSSRKLDERRQRGLSRYYIAAGAGGLAVGVHTTQFEIREPTIGLFEPVLRLAAEEMSRADE